RAGGGQARGRAAPRHHLGGQRASGRRDLPSGAAARLTRNPSMARILVADDEDGIREFISDALSLDHHAVVQVPDGRAAARALDERAFDVVITDLKMPGMDGLALLRK